MISRTITRSVRLSNNRNYRQFGQTCKWFLIDVQIGRRIAIRIEIMYKLLIERTCNKREREIVKLDKWMNWFVLNRYNTQYFIPLNGPIVKQFFSFGQHANLQCTRKHYPFLKWFFLMWMKHTVWKWNWFKDTRKMTERKKWRKIEALDCMLIISSGFGAVKKCIHNSMKFDVTRKISLKFRRRFVIFFISFFLSFFFFLLCHIRRFCVLAEINCNLIYIKWSKLLRAWFTCSVFVKCRANADYYDNVFAHYFLNVCAIFSFTGELFGWNLMRWILFGIQSCTCQLEMGD